MARKKNPYKDVDKFLNTKLPVRMAPVTTWKDLMFNIMLEVFTTGKVPTQYNYHGIDWRKHVADGMKFDGDMKVLRKHSDINEKKFAKHFERILDRLFYVDEETKIAHFTKLFTEHEEAVKADNRRVLQSGPEIVYDHVQDQAWANREQRGKKARIDIRENNFEDQNEFNRLKEVFK